MIIRIRPEEIDQVISRIGQQWMLVTAASDGAVGTMTASWGGMGVLWGKPMAMCVVRPQRHTFGFIDRADAFTLSFLPEDCRETMNLCGKLSGHDGDKLAAAGLTLQPLESGAPAFTQAELTLECKKLYADFIKPDSFVTDEERRRWYPNEDYHKMFIGEITGVWKKN